MAAALEGAIAGVPSIAISVEGYGGVDFKQAGIVAERVIGAVLQARSAARWTFLNINIPAAQAQDIRGVRISRQNVGGFEERFEERRDPRGEIIYWMTGGIKPLRESRQDDTRHMADKYVTITPLCYDMTNYKLKEILEETGIAGSLEMQEDEK